MWPKKFRVWKSEAESAEEEEEIAELGPHTASGLGFGVKDSWVVLKGLW